MYRWLIGSAAAVIFLGAAISVTLSQTPPRRIREPANVIVILADDMGWADNSIFKDMGGRFPTPNLERLARSGVRFTHAYVTASVCAPSRAGLLTGRYQNRFGYEHLPDPMERTTSQSLGLDPAELTLAEVLHRSGYRTSLIGKWHLGVNPAFYPTHRGFDEFYGILDGGTPYIRKDAPGVHLGTGGARVETTERPADLAVVRGPDRQVVNNFDDYLTEDFTKQATQFIERSASRPFFLYLAYNAPHIPWEVTDKYFQRFPDIKDNDTRIVAAMVSALDDGVGEVLDALDRTGKRENTLIVFLSDNGCPTYLGACVCQPLRGGKLTQFEGGTRTPMVMSWPKGLPMGMTYDKVASSLDIFPTAVHAAATRLPADRRYDGVDLAPYLKGGVREAPHRTLFWWREPYEAMLEGGWKLWRSADNKVNMLFDLEHDPNETTNLFSREPGRVARMSKMMDVWHGPMKPAAFEGTPPGFTIGDVCGIKMQMPN